MASHTDKPVKINLRVELVTNGKKYGPGTVEVPFSIAEDLERRQHEYEEDKRRQLADNGENIDALHGETLKG